MNSDENEEIIKFIRKENILRQHRFHRDKMELQKKSVPLSHRRFQQTFLSEFDLLCTPKMIHEITNNPLIQFQSLLFYLILTLPYTSRTIRVMGNFFFDITYINCNTFRYCRSIKLIKIEV